MKNLTEFGQTLRILRIERKVMLREMAEAMGVSSPYLSAIESGKKNINASLIGKIVDVLQLSQDEEEALIHAASVQEQEVTIKPNNRYEAELSLMFARKLEKSNLTRNTELIKEKLKELFNALNDEDCRKIFTLVVHKTEGRMLYYKRDTLNLGGGEHMNIVNSYVDVKRLCQC